MVRLRTPSALVYRIDANDHIVFLSPEWAEEAPVHESPDLKPDRLIGRTLWDSLADPAVQGLYRAIVARVRTGRRLQFFYRCDTPDRRRLYRMEIRLVDIREVEFMSTLDSEQVRPPVALLDHHHARDQNHTLAMCSWCQRVALPVDYWVAIEEAAAIGGFMEANPLPRLVPGVCPQCERQVRKQLES
jgi:hypothetical protein